MLNPEVQELTPLRCTKQYRFGTKVFDFSERTFIMGVLNVTPDSFSDGGRYMQGSAAVERALQMAEEGADIIDIGGESTRPRGAVYGEGSRAVSVEEELQRVIPVIESIAKRTDVPLSIDTWKSRVAGEALDAGAVIVNDISGFHFDPLLPEVVRRKSASAVVMHTPAPPWEMPDHVEYTDVVEDVAASLRKSLTLGETAGIRQMIVDPGLGFGKSLKENYRLIARLDRIATLRYPILVGISRKSFIGKLLHLPVESRLEGSLAAMTAAILRGANVVRVHDVLSSRRAAAVADELVRS